MDSGEGDEEPEDVVRALKDPEYPQIPHDFLQSSLSHVAHASEDLDGLVGDPPGGLRGVDLADGGLELVVLKRGKIVDFLLSSILDLALDLGGLWEGKPTIFV